MHAQLVVTRLLADLQVVVDAVDPSLLASTSTNKTFDFGTIREEELHDIEIPLALEVGKSKRLPSLRTAECKLPDGNGQVV